MSTRVAKKPIQLPQGVTVTMVPYNMTKQLTIKGPKGESTYVLPQVIDVAQNDNALDVIWPNLEKQTRELAGTTRANLNNLVIGVFQGFKKELLINGVGYRAQASANKLMLTLGFSHPVEYLIPEGITITTPQPTEIVVEGINKQQVGQVASEIRAYRPPEPYKGKGVRYKFEVIVKKETKKK
jgi:large subunit ribosomal protein L6